MNYVLFKKEEGEERQRERERQGGGGGGGGGGAEQYYPELCQDCIIAVVSTGWAITSHFIVAQTVYTKHQYDGTATGR